MSGGGYECTTCRTFHVYSTYLLTRIGRETLIHGCQCGAKHRLTIKGAIQMQAGTPQPSLPTLPTSERAFNAALVPPVDEPPVELPVTEWYTEGHPVHIGWYELQFESAANVSRWWWSGLRYHMSGEPGALHIEADAPAAWRGVQMPVLGQVFKTTKTPRNQEATALLVGEHSVMMQFREGVQRAVDARCFYDLYAPAP